MNLPRRNPASHPRDVTLAQIRARAAAGLSIAKQAVRDTGLFDRAVRHFGNWSTALEAAALTPHGSSRGPRHGARRTQPLTEALLQAAHSNHALAAMTGIDRKSIRALRRKRGIVSPHSAAVPASAGRRPASPPLPSRPSLPLTASERATMTARLPTLEARSADIIRRRWLKKHPESLRFIGVLLRLSGERVRQLEAAALVALFGERRARALRLRAATPSARALQRFRHGARA